MALTAGVTTLGLGALRRVPPESRPRIRPGAVAPGIVHLGLGAFHRAHQAVYTEDAIAEAGGDWGIVGVAPRSAELVDVIAAQDNLFSVTSRDGSGACTRVVGSLADARHAPSDPMAIVALLADPAIKVVTLTVTEKAYRLDPATGVLRADDEVLADLAGDRPPGTVPGLLARGLIARAHADAGPIALITCDNLPDNGRRLRGMVSRALELANGRAGAAGAAGGASVAGPAWLAANVTFPGTTIDRIVPATTAETLAEARAALGVADLAAVAAEPYRQWVIEDAFLGARPAWERAGAVLTGDVTPWERLKLRTLNGVHSALAYLGALAGCETIADALALPGMAEYLRRLIAEDIAASFSPPPGVTVVEYGDSVLERFANPAIRHRTLQVAMDGTQKLPQRILHTMLDRRAAGGEPRWAALAVAAWMRFAAGVADDGRELPLDDPLAAEVRHTLHTIPNPAALLDLDRVFPPEFSGDPALRRLVLEWLHELGQHGAAATVRGAGQ